MSKQLTFYPSGLKNPITISADAIQVATQDHLLRYAFYSSHPEDNYFAPQPHGFIDFHEVRNIGGFRVYTVDTNGGQRSAGFATLDPSGEWEAHKDWASVQQAYEAFVKKTVLG